MTLHAASMLTEPLLLLDESLSSAVAQALQLVDYNITTVAAVFRREGVLDPDIIAWCQDHQAVWVHADDRARNEHRASLQTSGIRTLWIRRQRGSMSRSEQLRILTFVLPRLFENLQRTPRVRHYSAAAASPTSAPSLRPLAI